jgi:hypothetical protein
MGCEGNGVLRVTTGFEVCNCVRGCFGSALEKSHSVSSVGIMTEYTRYQILGIPPSVIRHSNVPPIGAEF